MEVQVHHEDGREHHEEFATDQAGYADEDHARQAEQRDGHTNSPHLYLVTMFAKRMNRSTFSDIITQWIEQDQQSTLHLQDYDSSSPICRKWLAKNLVI